MPTKKARDLVFLNAAEDDALRLALHKHLSALERDGLVHVWSADDIEPGADAVDEARAALDRADLIVIFVSADLLASNHFAEEMDRALSLQASKKAKVFPLEARPVDWNQTPFHGRKPLNDEPLSSTADLDEALAEVAAKIRKELVPPALNPHEAHRSAAPMR